MLGLHRVQRDIYIAEHFIDSKFIDRIFYRYDISKTKHFINGTFQRHDVSWIQDVSQIVHLQTGQFIDRTFYRQDISQTRHFIHRKFHNQDISWTGHLIDRTSHEHFHRQNIFQRTFHRNYIINRTFYGQIIFSQIRSILFFFQLILSNSLHSIDR